jgi:hypothetical protein
MRPVAPRSPASPRFRCWRTDPTVGEQFVDLFAAGGYALAGRMHAALAQPSLAWVFYLLAAAGLLAAIVQGSIEQRPDLWLRHLAAVALASVLTLMPMRVELAPLTYAAPGRIEAALDTRAGAAPHLTYWIERMGARAASALRDLTHARPSLALPGIEAQARSVAEDPALLDDAQLRANLEIWRRRIAPALLAEDPSLARAIRARGLEQDFANPAPADASFSGGLAARAREVRALLEASGVDVARLAGDLAASTDAIAADAGATPWMASAGARGELTLRPCEREIPEAGSPTVPGANPAWVDALDRGARLARKMRAAIPTGCAALRLAGAARLHEALGNSLLAVAGTNLVRSTAREAILGSLCQRAGEPACSGAMEALPAASAQLAVPAPDRYNRDGWTTLLHQPIATILLTVTSLLLDALSTLVVSVLPFALGVAKALAILVSTVGAWILLWPGRARIALSWMVGPIAFVSLWGLLFQVWADIEPALSQVGSVVGHADHGSFAAGRAMSIAISLGYLGLPSLALGIIYGQSGRALYHASARMENALMTAWHSRGAMMSFGRRWITNSPLARRWNQRTYKAVGLGTLPGSYRGTRTRKSPAAPRPAAAPKPRAPAIPRAPAKPRASSRPSKGQLPLL